MNVKNLITLLVGLCLGTAALAQASGDDAGIAPQPLNKALEEFASKSGLQVIYVAELADGKQTAGARPYLSDVETLDQLLASTGLEYEFLNDRTVTVQAAEMDVAQETGGDSEAGKSRTAAPPIMVRRASAESRRGSAVSSEEDDAYSSEYERLRSERAIPEILVLGKRSLNVDIERTEDDTQPYVVFGSDEIERSMAGNIEEFVKTRLPMNTVQSTWSQQTNSINGNRSQINLRGLGVNQTLILVNGRRLPEVSLNSQQFSQPDINGIPLSAVERIEVLPSTASGIYGGGATGGVINIILKHDYAGLEMRASYDNSFDSDVARRTLGMNAGFSLEGGNTHVLLSASYSDQNPLFNGERDFTRRAREKLLANAPVSFTSPAYPPQGYTTNIRSAQQIYDPVPAGTPGSLSGFPVGYFIPGTTSAPTTAENPNLLAVATPLTLKDGTPLNSPHTFVPVGYSGLASDGGAALVANAGSYNLELPDTILGSRNSLLSGPVTSALSANVRRRFGERVEGFIDLSWNENRGRAIGGALPRSFTLPADAPNNPFTTAVRVTFPFTGAEFETVSQTETLRGLAGVIVRLPYDWISEVDYSWGRSRLEYTSTSPMLHSDINLALANGTLDVMRDLNVYPLDYSEYALPSPNYFYGPADSVLSDVTLRLAGPTVRLPAGPISLSAMIEHREQEAEGSYRRGLETGSGNYVEPFYAYFYPRYQTVSSLYLEGLVPLVSERNALPGVRGLELQLSVRRDEYETKSVPGSTSIYANSIQPPPEVEYFTNEVASRGDTIGFRYVPVEDLMLRVSYGTGFLPPAIHQIAPSIFQNVDQSSYTDPKRGDTSLGVIGTLAQQGNPDAEPEDSKSWSAGLVFQPRILSDLRLSVDYTRIEKTNELGYLSTTQLLQYEDLFPGRIVRGPLTAEDTAQGYTAGPITAIYEGTTNFAYTEVEALDLQVDYSWSTESLGTFSLFALGTRQLSFIKQVSLDVEPVDSVGFSSSLPWRANGGLNWSRGSWTAGWNVQYYDSYILHAADAAPGTIDFYERTQGTTRIPRQVYHDAFAKYRFGESSFGPEILANLEVAIGIQNVFDTSPPIIASTGATGGYSSYGDPRLRAYSVSLRKRW